ncbi:hypothetical protein Tco_1183455 [Tanacetum coccineum]
MGESRSGLDSCVCAPEEGLRGRLAWSWSSCYSGWWEVCCRSGLDMMGCGTNRGEVILSDIPEKFEGGRGSVCDLLVKIVVVAGRDVGVGDGYEEYAGQWALIISFDMKPTPPVHSSGGYKIENKATPRKFDDVKFKFLKLLDLDYILLNEEMIECLTISFPLLEEMHLYRCYVEPKERIEYYTQNGLDTLCIMKLRRFLNKKNEFKVFKLVLSGQKPIDVEQLKAIKSPPYELERVELELEFVPRTSFKVVGAYTYLKLLEQEDERQTNTYLVMSSSSIAEKRFIDLFELLKELPRDRLDQTITFIKEEGQCMKKNKRDVSLMVGMLLSEPESLKKRCDHGSQRLKMAMVGWINRRDRRRDKEIERRDKKMAHVIEEHEQDSLEDEQDRGEEHELDEIVDEEHVIDEVEVNMEGFNFTVGEKVADPTVRSHLDVT